MTHAADILGESHWPPSPLSPWSTRVSLRRNGGPECLPTWPDFSQCAKLKLQSTVFLHIFLLIKAPSSQFTPLSWPKGMHSDKPCLYLWTPHWKFEENLAWSLHGCVHFTQNTHIDIFGPDKNRQLKQKIITFICLIIRWFIFFLHLTSERISDPALCGLACLNEKHLPQ